MRCAVLSGRALTDGCRNAEGIQIAKEIWTIVVEECRVTRTVGGPRLRTGCASSRTTWGTFPPGS
jgi:hypothetical protein